MAIDERLMKHARGAMIGLAIGDALGMPTQSMSAERIIECYGGPVRRLMDAVPQQPIAPNMKAGSVTDDTEQAFVLAARLIEDHGRIDNDAYAQDLLRWEAKMKEKGSLDLLGPSTKAALQALAEGIESNPAWAGLTAVKEGRYILLPKELFHNKPNHRWGESYEILADYLYAEEAA